MVDALRSVDYPGRLEPIFARYGMVFGAFMLVSTTAGGFLGQLDLWIPYAVRAAVLIPAFLLGLLVMRDQGFKGRPLTLGSFSHETRRIAAAGITYGLLARVVRFIMLATLVQGVFFIYGFYGWLNARIPSQERATIISLDALLGDGGMTVGQVGLGYLSQAVSIPFARLIGGLTQVVGVPLLGAARRAERAESEEAAARPDRQARAG